MPRTIAGSVAAVLFAAQLSALDVYFRGGHAYAREPRLVLNAAASVALWYLLWTFRGAAKIALSVGTAVLLTAELVAFRYYHTPIEGQVIKSALHCWDDVRPIAVGLLPEIAAMIAAISAFEYGLLRLSSGRPARSRRLSACLVLVFSLAFGSSIADGTPDLRLVASLGDVWEPRAEAAKSSVQIPIIPSSRAELPSVLFIVTESVRAQDYCSAFAPDCAISPEVNALLPHRVPLRQLRALASYTAISISALISGRTQRGTRAEIEEAPTLFDFLRAVRRHKAKPYVAYWSAQNESLFERKDIRTATDSFVTLATLMGRPTPDEDAVIDQGVDRLLAARVAAELASAPKPLFAMVHLAGTHAPYFVEARDAPFSPWARVVAWSKMPLLRNAYKNAIFEQDKSVAACIRAFLEHQGGSPYLIVFTSDHGESFGEHSAIHHGQNLYDEQIHVPGFIAFGNGALSASEAQNLRRYEAGYVTHLDLLPTILDAYGALDAIAMAPYRPHFAGRSLLQPFSTMAAPIPITNCTATFPCVLNNWGILQDDRAIFAQPWDSDWNCLDFATGTDRAPWSDQKCQALREASKAFFSLLPNGAFNR